METIKVRIRLCVDEQGNYNAWGWGGREGGANVDNLHWLVSNGMPEDSSNSPEPVRAWHWIEAEVPLPKVDVIQGRVGE